MANLPNDPPRAAYVHVPFCRHRCGYCNFTLISGRDDLIESYLLALEQELRSLPASYELDSLYLGGGTPTHLPTAQLEKLFQLLLAHLTLAPGAEFTVEANPLDLIPTRCDVLQAYKVNRISLGVQSFHDAKLAVLERDHRANDVQVALERAQRVALRVSLDLIFAAPQETLEDWERDLTLAMETGVGHISCYGLTIEQGSAFYGRRMRGQLPTAPEELESQMYELAIEQLQARGWEQYEISNFACKDQQSQHNITYWRGRSYFAFGPGAARYVQGRREMNHRSTTTYIARLLQGESAVAESEMLSPEDRARERIVFGLRMLAGISREEIWQDTGYDLLAVVGREIETAVSQGLLTWQHDRLRLTRRGLLVSDALWPAFIRV
jgi:oxygen-independent coproporphyrinogen-3 oxidase